MRVSGKQKSNIVCFNSFCSLKPADLITQFIAVLSFFVSFAVPRLVIFYAARPQRWETRHLV